MQKKDQQLNEKSDKFTKKANKRNNSVLFNNHKDHFIKVENSIKKEQKRILNGKNKFNNIKNQFIQKKK